MVERIASIDPCGDGQNVYSWGEEIVRCRDCGWCDDQGGFRWCGHWENGVAEDGFCAWGERKDDAD